jgi:hypothetical protein
LIINFKVLNIDLKQKTESYNFIILKEEKMFKKLLFMCTVVFLLIFFTLPAFAYADTNDVDNPVDLTDNATFIGTTDGQYQVQDKNYGNNYGSNDTADPNNGEIIDVLCIDTENSTSTGQIYDLADNTGTPSNPDNLVGELSPNEFTTNNFDNTDMNTSIPGDQHPSSTEKSNMAEDAVQILASTATGAEGTVKVRIDGNYYYVTPEQAAAWSFTNDLRESTGGSSGDRVVTDPNSIVDKIEENVTFIVEMNSNSNPADDIDLSTINSAAITLEDGLVDKTPAVGDGQLATLTMENPLIPAITDQNKNVYWYMLTSSYNVSFSPTELLLQAYFGDSSSDATKMIDYDVSGNDVSVTDSNYALNLQDNIGVATVSYYYFPWATAVFSQDLLDKGYNPVYSGIIPVNFTQADVMIADLVAYVDIDGDAALDLNDPNYDPALNVLEVPVDNTTIAGGTVLNPIDIEEEFVQEKTWHVTSEWDSHHHVWKDTSHWDYRNVSDGYKEDTKCNTQGLVVKAYNEPAAIATQYSVAAGEQGNGTITNLGITLVTRGLNSPDYTADPNSDSYVASVDKDGIFFGSNTLNDVSLDAGGFDSIEAPRFVFASFSVVPGPGPTPAPGPAPAAVTTAGVVDVAALTTGTTGGIQVLAFTGIDPIIPISAGSAIAGGLGLFITSLLKRNRKK